MKKIFGGTKTKQKNLSLEKKNHFTIWLFQWCIHNVLANFSKDHLSWYEWWKVHKWLTEYIVISCTE